MKTSSKILVAFSFLVCGLLGMGAYYSVSSKNVSVIPLKMNIVYAGLDNPFKITAAGVDPKDLIVQGSYGSSIIADTSEPGRYSVKASEIGATLTISVSAKSANGYAPLYSQNFRVKKMPDPVVYAGTKKGDADITKGELASIAGIVCKMENFDFDCSCSVVDFKMSVVKDGAWVDYSATGPNLSTAMKTELSNANPGARIIFHDVNEKGSDGISRKLPGLILTVK